VDERHRPCEAGLRLGEMVALEWTDIDFAKRQVCVQRSAWKGQVASPRGGRLRYVPLTNRLATALKDNRHLRGSLVLYQDDGTPLTEGVVQGFVRRAAQKAGLYNNGPHMLRHSFCSHLAMLGAPARAIQELAGHQDLITTQRYMHLSPAALGTAVQLLDFRRERGDILETGFSDSAKSFGWDRRSASALRATADNLRLSVACQPKLTEERGKPEVSEGWRRERDSNPNNAFL